MTAGFHSLQAGARILLEERRGRRRSPPVMLRTRAQLFRLRLLPPCDALDRLGELLVVKGQIGPPALAYDPGPSRTLAPAPLDQVQRQQRDRDEEEVQHHEKLDRAHSRRAQINDVCSCI